MMFGNIQVATFGSRVLTSALRRLKVNHLRFQLGHEVANGFPAWLTIHQAAVVEQPMPVIDRVFVDGAPSPASGAGDSSDEVRPNGSFNAHPLSPRAIA
jgi:hypothetical protein